mgnify:CR=1 FL=1
MEKAMPKNSQKELYRLNYLINTLRDARYLASIISEYKCVDKERLLLKFANDDLIFSQDLTTLVTNFIHKLEEELKTFSPDNIHEAIQYCVNNNPYHHE